ncbi:agamous-like MADS-box protein AGL80 [Cicer arietinum]|uniref:Agamous-like MADS-box protein AGL80 n=1 Tax=Cicer arietinum TaxID=3827 RepID=A0A1S2Y8S6_CICAR|nr:agamous-like MADS-box protein AGL80 [Cicer arietinum]
MDRRKVKLAYIISNINRRATFRKRKHGLLKKVRELCTLCGIEACAIIYGENDTRADVWPSTTRARSILSRFMSLSKAERRKKMVDLEGFLTQSIAKAEETLKKQRNGNKKEEMGIIISQYIRTGEYNLGHVNENYLNDLSEFIGDNIKKIDMKMKSMEDQAQEEAGNEVEPMNDQDE